MKIQYIAVVFVIIILPISIVMSYYINTQMDTISLQTSYNTKLNDSTYDAMKAFQLNTVNNRYSSVSDSKIRDIEASISTFFNSLSNNEQLSLEDLKSYVPALVYTLYDGYYIYSKYDNLYPENNGQVLDEDDAESAYGLKPYIYYACRYKKGSNTDFVVNYTLDNAITIYGTINGTYYTLSGYLINPNNVTNVSFSESNPISGSLKYNGITITKEQLTEHILFADGSSGDYNYLEYNGQKIYYDKNKTAVSGETSYFYYQDYSKSYITNSSVNTEIINYLTLRTSGGVLYSTSSIEYYYNAQKFSTQVINLIGDITQRHAVDEDGNQIGVSTEEGVLGGFYVDTGTSHIFNTTESGNDPLLSSSIFNENRMAAIRRSIETYLSAAIANYNDYSGNNYEFSMPVLSEVDWEKITNNVSVISFLQGIPIGHKYYNNYCVITNNNNEEVVKKENIYIVTKNASGQLEYHLPGCPDLIEDTSLTIVGAYSSVSFIRQTVRISEGDYLYFYPQNVGGSYITSCYTCIVNATNVYDIDQIIAGTIYENKYGEVTSTVKYSASSNSRFATVRAYYLRALGREKYDLYQANMTSFNTD